MSKLDWFLTPFAILYVAAVYVFDILFSCYLMRKCGAWIEFSSIIRKLYVETGCKGIVVFIYYTWFNIILQLVRASLLRFLPLILKACMLTYSLLLLHDLYVLSYPKCELIIDKYTCNSPKTLSRVNKLLAFQSAILASWLGCVKGLFEVYVLAKRITSKKHG